jgi:hypothetical protein
VYLGARFSSRAPDHAIRPALIVVLTASALKLLGVGTILVGAIAAVLGALGVAYAVRAQQRLRATSVSTNPPVATPALRESSHSTG